MSNRNSRSTRRKILGATLGGTLSGKLSGALNITLSGALGGALGGISGLLSPRRAAARDKKQHDNKEESMSATTPVASVSESTAQITTADGLVDTHLFVPRSADGTTKRWPVVLFYMDGLGIRPDLLDMARRIATQGYYVMLPDLYYRATPEQRVTGPVDFEKDPKARDRIMVLVQSVTRPATMRDTRVFFDFLDRQPEADASRVGCVGYCMGGGLALTAAGTFPERVVVAASIHGAALAIDRDDSPHKLAGSMRGKIYVGISEVDPYLVPGEMDLLEQTLKAAGVDHTMEVYPKVMHGFAVPGQVYDREASERHWQRILGLFDETLRR